MRVEVNAILTAGFGSCCSDDGTICVINQKQPTFEAHPFKF